MQKTAQSWFTGGPSSGSSSEQQNAPSLLADWNSYAASKSADEDAGSLGFDIEAAVRTANDKVSGTFNVYVRKRSLRNLLVHESDHLFIYFF